MIARLAVFLLLAIGAVGGYLLLTRGDEAPPTYTLVIDNAFGLTEDADIKAAGVRVGKVVGLDVQPSTYRAEVTVEIENEDFGEFRTDVFCRVQPQSLIGEYFLNCDPGTKPQALPEGSTIPVEQTGTTVPPDLINNIMRRPWRERFGIIIDELGRGLATRGDELQQVIRRAVPALRETDRVLRILADNRQTLQALTREADQVMFRLANNRDDVARFVVEARDTASASADRRVDLQEDIRLLPTFLRRLRPVLRDLGTAAERQTPALRDLRRAAPDLELLLERLGPFAEASVPAVRSLGEASVTGRQAMRTAGATIAELREMANLAEDPISNLRFILEHLDNRDFAVEKNPLSPGGQGFTGLEALLQYPFVQSQAINIFDRRGYILKLNILPTQCSAYRDAESVRNNPELAKECSAALGPGPAPGIDYEVSGESSDPNDGGGSARSGGGGGAAPARADGPDPLARDGDANPKPRPGGAADGLLDDLLKRPPKPKLPAKPKVPAQAPAVPAAPEVKQDQESLLDFLLGP